MNSAQVDAYLSRLGVRPPAWPTIDVLRELQLRHLQTVPFENLAIHLGEEIVLEEKRLLDKVVGARRGGFCYELNGAFGALLAALGYDVSLLAGRGHTEEGRLGIPYDHLALRVRTVDAGEWLADVGFGALSHYPLVFEEGHEQEDPGGAFRIIQVRPEPPGTRGPGTPDVDLVRDGRPVYRLETRPRALGDFVAGAWWHTTSPQSHFVQSLVCSRLTEDGGRITLSGRQLKVTAPDGTRDARELETDEEVLAVYRERFGIVLDRVPVVRGSGGGGGAS
ncbi:arylamine N-acetyltransferase [Streptomyces sp. NPDC089424]|uniref:arylamine N-acetyltransferase family protein n=1 Tax=Streptomyces sp. NPDC089424 TaxID=3365917 RepID=UPI003826D90F